MGAGWKLRAARRLHIGEISGLGIGAYSERIPNAKANASAGRVSPISLPEHRLESATAATRLRHRNNVISRQLIADLFIQAAAPLMEWLQPPRRARQYCAAEVVPTTPARLHLPGESVCARYQCRPAASEIWDAARKSSRRPAAPAESRNRRPNAPKRRTHRLGNSQRRRTPSAFSSASSSVWLRR